MKNNKKPRIIITGCFGYLGSYLTYFLLKKNFKVLGIDNLFYDNKNSFQFIDNKNFSFLNLDLNKNFNKIKILQNDIIIHLAALVGPVCENNKKLAWKTNVKTSIKLANKVNKKKARLIFLSTCSNYGKLKGFANENSDLIPLGFYAKTKVSAEKQIILTSKKFKILRLGTLAGLSFRPRFDLTINQFLFAAWKYKKIEVFMKHAFRPYINIKDAVELIHEVINRYDKLKYNIYNISGFNVSKEQIIDMIKPLIPKLKIKYKNDKDLRDYKVSFLRAKKEFKYKIKYSFRKTILEILNFLNIYQIKDDKYYKNSN